MRKIAIIFLSISLNVLDAQKNHLVETTRVPKTYVFIEKFSYAHLSGDLIILATGS